MVLLRAEVECCHLEVSWVLVWGQGSKAVMVLSAVGFDGSDAR